MEYKENFGKSSDRQYQICNHITWTCTLVIITIFQFLEHCDVRWSWRSKPLFKSGCNSINDRSKKKLLANHFATTKKTSLGHATEWCIILLSDVHYFQCFFKWESHFSIIITLSKKETKFCYEKNVYFDNKYFLLRNFCLVTERFSVQRTFFFKKCSRHDGCLFQLCTKVNIERH